MVHDTDAPIRTVYPQSMTSAVWPAGRCRSAVRSAEASTATHPISAVVIAPPFALRLLLPTAWRHSAPIWLLQVDLQAAPDTVSATNNTSTDQHQSAPTSTNNNQHQSASISTNQHQQHQHRSAPISTNQHKQQSASISTNQHQQQQHQPAPTTPAPTSTNQHQSAPTTTASASTNNTKQQPAPTSANQH